MIKANYLFNTVSRKKLDDIEMEFKSRIPLLDNDRKIYLN